MILDEERVASVCAALDRDWQRHHGGYVRLDHLNDDPEVVAFAADALAYERDGIYLKAQPRRWTPGVVEAVYQSATSQRIAPNVEHGLDLSARVDADELRALEALREVDPGRSLVEHAGQVIAVRRGRPDERAASRLAGAHARACCTRAVVRPYRPRR